MIFYLQWQRFLLTSSTQHFHVPSFFTKPCFCFSISLSRTVSVFRTQICCRAGICPFWIRVACSHPLLESDWYELSQQPWVWKRFHLESNIPHLSNRRMTWPLWRGPWMFTWTLLSSCKLSSSICSLEGVIPQGHTLNPPHHLSCQTRNGLCTWVLNILEMRGFFSKFWSAFSVRKFVPMFSFSCVAKVSLQALCFLATFKNNFWYYSLQH